MSNPRKCEVKYCRRDAAPGRKKCYRCRSRAYKERNPDMYTFNALRNNAKRRGKDFTLTFDEFRGFCNDTGYMEGKGKNADSLSIDRSKNHIGYTKENIRILTLSQNSSKRNNEDYCPF